MTLLHLIGWHRLPPYLKRLLLEHLHQELYVKLEPDVTSNPDEMQQYREHIQTLNATMVSIGLSLSPDVERPIHERLNATGLFDFRVATQQLGTSSPPVLIDSSGMTLSLADDNHPVSDQSGQAIMQAIHSHPSEALVLQKSFMAGTHSTIKVNSQSQIKQEVTPTSAKDSGNVVTLAPGKKGSWNKQLNTKLKSNQSYKVGDHTYKTDANGRVNRVSGKLQLKTRDRNTYQQSKSSKTGGIKDGLPRDDGGHLVASTFSGAGEQINYLPMDSNLNRSAWLKMENEWRSALKAAPPKDVKVDILPLYGRDSNRPDAFAVRYWTNGKSKVKFFYNRPGK
ncbi:DNA/RNA non-specific endonuclease [Vibrio sp. YT-17]|uniref:DNA/RNA non-specific endonuclease n=1 Tax=Vibrio sp. YT-17 TaxID=3074708 RepID=UPI00296506DF|nr:DNA/RNA non-specific endonuclease [Vibrio sp. YT-17]MDW1539143.1 DNA/RNA non-specific endonuclease [Vibrio sp. YT-17]